MFKALKNKVWWANACERAVKTFFQSLVAVGGVISFTSYGDFVSQWLMVIVSSAIAAVLSLFTSICNYETILANNNGND